VTEAATKKPVQFSVRSQLAVTTVLALICGSVVLFGWEALGVVDWILELAAMAALGTVAAYSRGYRRTFCAAALFGAAATFYFGLPRYGLPANPFLYVVLRPLARLIAAAVSGTIAIFSRRFVERRGWHLPE
jgi:hypothetical protein